MVCMVSAKMMLRIFLYEEYCCHYVSREGEYTSNSNKNMQVLSTADKFKNSLKEYLASILVYEKSVLLQSPPGSEYNASLYNASEKD